MHSNECNAPAPDRTGGVTDVASNPRWAGRTAMGILAAAFITVAAGALAQSSPVPLAPGSRTVISLTENPSTGYVWRFDPDGSTNAGIVKVTDLGFVRPHSAQPMAGAAGLHRWSIEGLRSGRAKLHFFNSRPWEGTPAKQQTIPIEVR